MSDRLFELTERAKLLNNALMRTLEDCILEVDQFAMRDVPEELLAYVNREQDPPLRHYGIGNHPDLGWFVVEFSTEPEPTNFVCCWDGGTVEPLQGPPCPECNSPTRRWTGATWGCAKPTCKRWSIGINGEELLPR